MPIRVRLALLFAAGAALLLAAGGLLFIHELSDGLRGSLVAALETRAGAIVSNLPDGPGPNFSDQAPASPGPGGEGAEGVSQLLTPAGAVQDASGSGSGRPLITPAQLARARRAQLVTQRLLPGADSPELLLAMPVGGGSPLVVVAGTSLETLNEAVHRVVVGLAVAGPMAVVLAGLGAWLLAGAALAPVERMRRQAADISAQDQEAVLAVPATRDELASLARTLNSLLGRLQGALSRQRGFVSSAGHELRTPLAILRAELELAARPGRSRDELAAAVREAGAETERLVRLAEDLLLLARSDEAVPLVRLLPQEVVPVVARSVERFGERATQAGVELGLAVQGVGPERDLVAPVDEVRLGQVVDNLIDNALRFAPAGTVVDVTVRPDGPQVAIEVADRGPGFPPDFLPYAFHRFRRSDDARGRDHGGAGLGLSIVRALVEAQHGQVTAVNRPEGGATLRVVLPTSHPEGRPRTRTRAPALGRPRSRRA